MDAGQWRHVGHAGAWGRGLVTSQESFGEAVKRATSCKGHTAWRKSICMIALLQEICCLGNKGWLQSSYHPVYRHSFLFHPWQTNTLSHLKDWTHVPCCISLSLGQQVLILKLLNVEFMSDDRYWVSHYHIYHHHIWIIDTEYHIILQVL